MASTSTTDRQSVIDITNAFEEIAPPSASTSATFSAQSPKLPWDIFINHRGPDVKHTLATAIYNAVYATGLRVFLDSEELQLADFIPAALREAMRSARLHIAIFSPGYAQSPWCLSELSFMLKSGTPIIPVFYLVQPTDLRWVAEGKGMYVNAFLEHQEKGRYSLEKLQEWKMALHNVSFNKGEIINNNDEEQRALKNIVNRAMKIMKIEFEVAKHSVGLEEVASDFEKALNESAKSHLNVQIVGIWGMGGSGKTTLAKQLYNKKCSSVENSSFLFDVRDAATKSELHKKQKKLLQDLGFEGKPFDSMEEGKKILSNYLRSRQVFGGLLYGCSSKDLLEDLLHKVSKILPNDIKNKLRVSYDALDEEEKQMFLDIACFFIGKDKMTAIAVWDGSGWSGRYGWERLVNKCVVDFDDNNGIRMHDHLRDLGREIAKTQLPCRLWSPDQITGIQKRTEIRGMILNAATNGVHKFPARLHGLKVFVVGEKYGNSLHIVKLSRELALLSCTEIADTNLPSWLPLKNLRVLELHCCWNMVGLWKDRAEAPVQLRVLNISYCSNLVRIPNSIRYLENFKKMSLFSCNVESLPKQFCRLQSLEHLQLRSCGMLSSLPSCFGHLTNLRHLDLSSSYKLKMLPDSFKQLKLLQHLNLEDCGILTLKPDILENMTRLEYLNLDGCTQLEELPRHIANQASLSELYLKATRLRKLPINIGQLSKLRVLDIFSAERCFQMQSLPDSMGSLNRLERLELENLEVESLPKSLKQLISLQKLKIICCPIRELDFGRGPFTSSLCSLKEIHLGNTKVSKISISEECCPGLQTLRLSGNDHLREVDTIPTTVEDIELYSCTSLRKINGIGGAVNLRKLKLKDCPQLNELPGFDKLSSLEVFVLEDGNRVEKIQGLQQCTSLEKLHCSCWEVPRIESLEYLQRLRRLVLVAKKRSAVERGIQKIQKWPEEMIICTKAVPGAGSLLNSSSFPNLSILHSFANKEISCIPSRLARMPQKRSSNANAIMLCLLINCVSLRMPFAVSGDYFHTVFSTEVDCGQWIWMGVFTEHSRCLIAQDLFTSQLGTAESYSEYNEMEKGFLVRGEEHSVMEAFHRLLALLGKEDTVVGAFHRFLVHFEQGDFDKRNGVVDALHLLFHRLLDRLGEEDTVVETFHPLLALLGEEVVEAFQLVLALIVEEDVNFVVESEASDCLMTLLSKEDIYHLLPYIESMLAHS